MAMFSLIYYQCNSVRASSLKLFYDLVGFLPFHLSYCRVLVERGIWAMRGEMIGKKLKCPREYFVHFWSGRLLFTVMGMVCCLARRPRCVRSCVFIYDIGIVSSLPISGCEFRTIFSETRNEILSTTRCL